MVRKDEEDGSPIDETEIDATVKEETTETTETVTPTDQVPERTDEIQGEGTPKELNRDLEQEREGVTAAESDNAELDTETPDSPELD